MSYPRHRSRYPRAAERRGVPRSKAWSFQEPPDATSRSGRSSPGAEDRTSVLAPHVQLRRAADPRQSVAFAERVERDRWIGSCPSGKEEERAVDWAAGSRSRESSTSPAAGGKQP